jgi:hypothetical protein
MTTAAIPVCTSGRRIPELQRSGEQMPDTPCSRKLVPVYRAKKYGTYGGVPAYVCPRCDVWPTPP